MSVYLKHNHKVLNIGGGGPSTATLDHSIVVKTPRGFQAGEIIQAGQYTAEQLLAMIKKEFEVAEKFKVELSVSPASSGTVTGGGSYNAGETAVLSATPGVGYEFEKWSDGNTSNPRNLVVETNVILRAMFKALPVPKAYITVVANPSNGGTVSGSGEYPIGSTATISATAALGYEFEQWDDGDSSNPRTITVEEAKTYTAKFKELPAAKVVINALVTPIGGGAILQGTGEYNIGDQVTMKCVASPGYQFVKWSNGATTETTTFTATKSETMVATFEEIPTGNFSAQGYTVTNKYDDEGEPTDEWYFTANGTKLEYSSEAELLSALTTGVQLKNPRPASAGGDDDCYIAFGVQGLPAGKTIICTNALGVNVATNPEKPTMQDGEVTIYVFRGSAGNAVCTYHI